MIFLSSWDGEKYNLAIKYRAQQNCAKASCEYKKSFDNIVA